MPFGCYLPTLWRYQGTDMASSFGNEDKGRERKPRWVLQVRRNEKGHLGKVCVWKWEDLYWKQKCQCFQMCLTQIEETPGINQAICLAICEISPPYLSFGHIKFVFLSFTFLRLLPSCYRFKELTLGMGVDLASVGTTRGKGSVWRGTRVSEHLVPRWQGCLWRSWTF